MTRYSDRVEPDVTFINDVTSQSLRGIHLVTVELFRVAKLSMTLSVYIVDTNAHRSAESMLSICPPLWGDFICEEVIAKSRSS